MWTHETRGIALSALPAPQGRPVTEVPQRATAAQDITSKSLTSEMTTTAFPELRQKVAVASDDTTLSASRSGRSIWVLLAIVVAIGVTCIWILSARDPNAERQPSSSRVAADTTQLGPSSEPNPDCPRLVEPYLAYTAQQINAAIRKWEYLPDFPLTRQLVDLPETRVQAATMKTLLRRHPECSTENLKAFTAVLTQNALLKSVQLEDFTTLVPVGTQVARELALPIEFASDGDTSDWRTVLRTIPTDVQVSAQPSDSPGVRGWIQLISTGHQSAEALSSFDQALRADAKGNIMLMKALLNEFIAHQPGSGG